MSSALEKKQAATQLSGSRISPLAGKPAPREMLVDLARLEKIYAESFKSESHLHAILSEAQEMVNNALDSGVNR